MNKDEILRKSREQKEDEGVIHADNSGRRYGFIGLTIMFAGHVLLVLLLGGSFAVPMSLWCSFTGAECFGKYKATSRKSDLFGGFALCFAAVVFFLSYLLWDLLKVMG